MHSQTQKRITVVGCVHIPDPHKSYFSCNALRLQWSCNFDSPIRFLTRTVRRLLYRSNIKRVFTLRRNSCSKQ